MSSLEMPRLGELLLVVLGGIFGFLIPHIRAQYKLRSNKTPPVNKVVNNYQGEISPVNMLSVFPDDLLLVSVRVDVPVGQGPGISATLDPITETVSHWRDRLGGATIVTNLPVTVTLLRHVDYGDDEGEEAEDEPDEEIKVKVTKGKGDSLDPEGTIYA